MYSVTMQHEGLHVKLPTSPFSRGCEHREQRLVGLNAFFPGIASPNRFHVDGCQPSFLWCHLLVHIFNLSEPNVLNALYRNGRAHF